MSLSQDDIQHIAHLARLAITDDEMAALKKDLDNILNLVEEMNSEDTEQVEPLAHPFEASQPLRKDVVTEENQRDHLLKNAPQTSAGLFIVPKVLETE